MDTDADADATVVPEIDVDVDPDLGADGYDALLDHLATDVYNRSGQGDREDALWDAVATVAPALTPQVCERFLELAAHGPDDGLVDEVTAFRGSDADERQRARAVTALVEDLQARLDDTAGRDAQ